MIRRAAVPMALVAAGWLAAGPALSAGYGLLWMQAWSSGAPAGLDVGTGVAVDPSGNIFVSGYSDRTELGEDLNIVLLKYSPDGLLLWTRTHNSFPGGMDVGNAVAADRQGNCYVAGSVSITGGASEGWLRKYNPVGDEVWTMTYGSPSGEQAVFYGVTVDPVSGSLYVAGCEVRGDLVQAGNGLVLKVGPGGGAPAWVVSADGYGLWDEYLAVALAPDGDVLVTGYVTTEDSWGWLDSAILFRPVVLTSGGISSVDTDTVVARYSPGGATRWRQAYDSEISKGDLTRDAGRGVAVNAAGAVFVSGVTVKSAAVPVDFDRWVRCYPGDGTSVTWTRQTGVGEGTYKTDIGDGCAVGPQGRVIVAGCKAIGDLGYDLAMTLEQFDPAVGYTLRSDDYQCCPFARDRGVAVAVDPGGNTVVAGWESRMDLGRCSILVRKLAGPAPDVPASSGVVAYPNPFDPGKAAGGTLKFAGLAPGARVSVWTISGLLVRRVEVRGDVAAWDARNGSGQPVGPGAYYWTVEAPGRKTVTGVIALVRP